MRDRVLWALRTKRPDAPRTFTTLKGRLGSSVLRLPNRALRRIFWHLAARRTAGAVRLRAHKTLWP